MRHDLDARLIRLYARALRNSLSFVASFSLIVAVFAPLFVALHAVAWWLGIQALFLGVARELAARCLAQDDANFGARLWRTRFIGLGTAQGLVWGLLAGLVLAGPDPATAHAFVFVTILTISAIAATIGAAIPAAVAASIGSMSAIVLVALVSTSPDLGTVPLVVLAGGVQLYLLRVAQELRATALESLSIQDEKDELIAELATAKAASDLARRRAEDANFAKSRFLAAMSHELRTPLNAILGFSEVMKGELFGTHSVTSYREYSNDIHASGQHLLVLINEILDLSRIEAGRFPLEDDAVRLSGVIEDCKHLLALRAKGRGIAIRSSAEPGLPPLRADQRAVRQMVLNLLSNAINFTPRDGTIEIKIGWTARGGQYFSVHDNGPGIPEEEIPTIMTPFGRGTLAHDNGEVGTGLGLSIVKGLVELHGGSFVLDSKLGDGTVVTVIFPCERVGAPRGATHSDHPDTRISAIADPSPLLVSCANAAGTRRQGRDHEIAAKSRDGGDA